MRAVSPSRATHPDRTRRAPRYESCREHNAAPIPFDLAVAMLSRAGLYDRDDGEDVLADCPVCKQQMRVSRGPGGTAVFKCYGATPDAEVVAALRDSGEFRVDREAPGPGDRGALFRLLSPEALMALPN